MNHYANAAKRAIWLERFPVDEHGRATSGAADALLRFLFEHRCEFFTTPEIARRLHIDSEFAQTMCRQLKMMEILEQEPSGETRYRYFLNSPNFELQARIEKAFIDEESRRFIRSLPYRPVE